MNQPTLPFFDFSDDSRLKFAQLVEEKPLSDRAKKFLRFAYDVATEHSRTGMRVRYYRRALIVSCLQERLGELLDNCSVKTVQRMFDELEECGVVSRRKVTPKTDGPPVQKTCYVVMLDELAALPSLDPTDELDCVILECDGDLRGTGEPDFRHPENDVAPDVASVVASVVVSDVASLISINHHHDSLSTYKTHDDDQSRPRPDLPASSVADVSGQEPLNFRSIRDDDVRLIAGFSVDGKGLPLRERWLLFLRYWADVRVTESVPVSDDDQLELLALFVFWGRNKTNRSRGGAVATWWRSRSDKPLRNTLTKDAMTEARRIRGAGATAAAVSAVSAGVASSMSAAVPAAAEPESPRFTGSLVASAIARLPADSEFREKLLRRSTPLPDD